jgi:biotin synthase-related radical SAM superfamily protein
VEANRPMLVQNVVKRTKRVKRRVKKTTASMKMSEIHRTGVDMVVDVAAGLGVETVDTRTKAGAEVLDVVVEAARQAREEEVLGSQVGMEAKGEDAADAEEAEEEDLAEARVQAQCQKIAR